MSLTEINPLWGKWCHQSVVISFKAALEAHGALYVDGRKRPKEETLPRFEIRIEGPRFNQVSRGCWYIDLEISVLTLTERNDEDVYSHQTKVGRASAAFKDVIPVYKYDGVTDPPALLGCLQEMTSKQFGEKVVITNFGLIEDTNKLVASVAEGHYQMCLKEV